jgi:hypothetical protein
VFKRKPTVSPWLRPEYKLSEGFECRLCQNKNST